MAELSLRLPALPENVVVVRELLRGVEPLLRPRPGLSEAVQTAVSEAANNVVVHAYGDVPGPLQVDVSLGRALEVHVRDWGSGYQPQALRGAGSGFGGAVIEAFADEVQVSSAPGAGTDVRLRWHVAASLPLPPTCVDEALPGETVLSLRPDPSLTAPTGRVLSALGARARLAIDRLADLQLIGDTLLRHAGPVLSGSRLSLVVLQRDGGLQLSAGPLVTDGGRALREARSIGGLALIERLATEVDVLSDPASGREALVLTMLRDDA